jgi:hypothetical protein
MAPAATGPPDGADPLSRRRFLRVSLQAAIASVGVYGVIEERASRRPRPGDAAMALARATRSLPLELSRSPRGRRAAVVT